MKGTIFCPKNLKCQRVPNGGVGPWCEMGDPVCILSLIFRYYLTKMKYLNLHSLFEVKLEKRSKKRSTHSIII